MSNNKGLCKKALPYLRSVGEEINDENANEENKTYIDSYNEELCITYLIDEDSMNPRFIINKNLVDENISEEELKKIALNNLIKKINEDLKIQEYNSGVYNMVLEGNLEASLILVEPLWEAVLNEYITDDYIVTIPTREVITFCDSSSKEGIEALKSVCESVKEEAEEMLTDTLYCRKDGQWVVYK